MPCPEGERKIALASCCPEKHTAVRVARPTLRVRRQHFCRMLCQAERRELVWSGSWGEIRGEGFGFFFVANC